MPWAEERACRMYPPAEEVEKIDDIADIMHNAVMEIWRLRRRPNAETAAAIEAAQRAELSKRLDAVEEALESHRDA
jgi:hypothetical protein